jgi:hypothetical protein
MGSIAVSMLRLAWTALKDLNVSVVLRTHALQGSTALQDLVLNRLALQERSATKTIKIASCSALQVPIAQPAQDHLQLSHQQMQITSMCRERQLTPKTNVAMAISALVALQVPMIRPAQQTLYLCLEKHNANSVLLESGVQQDPPLNLTVHLVSIVMELTLTPQSVLKEHLEQLRIYKVYHSALYVHLGKHVLRMV